MPFSVRVQAILAPRSDGSDAPWVTHEDIRAALRIATDIYRSSDVEFLFDPASDVATIRSDLLSRDCTLAPNANFDGPKTSPVVCGSKPNNDERNRVAELYPGKLVVFFAYGRAPAWDDATGHWIDGWGGNWSNHVDAFVRFGPWPPGITLSHEIGHYLHLVHTFPGFADQIDVSHLDDSAGKMGVRTLIRDFVQNNGLPRARGLELFDGDLFVCGGDSTLHCITDTPPDPGPALFQNEGLDPCAADQGTLTFDVQWPDGGVMAFTFAPDRENIMNYWDKTCRGLSARLSPDQISGVQDALVNQNRAHLTALKVLYSAVWEAGDRGTTRAIGWAFADFVSRFDTEIAAGRHLVHMQAYDLGGGQIRWDGAWEAGPTNPPRGTTRALGWAMADFTARFDAEIAAGHHLVHMQAYDLGGGQIRWDGVWEPGDRGTSFALGWGLQDFGAQFLAETSGGRHLVHLQAYDLGGGELRYDGVWEVGEAGNSGVMGWGFNDFVDHLEQESASGRRLVHQHVYDIGSGQLRYDGIWDHNASAGAQTRILSESMKRFAERFDTEIVAGRHVTSMQAVVGR